MVDGGSAPLLAGKCQSSPSEHFWRFAQGVGETNSILISISEKRQICRYMIALLRPFVSCLDFAPLEIIFTSKNTIFKRMIFFI